MDAAQRVDAGPLPPPHGAVVVASEAILIGVAVTATFTLFGLMLGLHASYQETIDNSSNDRLTADPPWILGLAISPASVVQLATLRLRGMSRAR